MSKIDDDQLYQISQELIEIWETFSEAMREQKLDIVELSFRTKLTNRELEDGLHNYSDIGVKNMFKIAYALGLKVDINLNKSDEKRGKGWITQTD